jgi:hypothetical protein
MEATTGRGVARVVLVAILLSLTFSGTWFEVRGKGVYTEGLEREPTIWVNYTVDAEDEVIGVQITNATPLIHSTRRAVYSRSAPSSFCCWNRFSSSEPIAGSAVFR